MLLMKNTNIAEFHLSLVSKILKFIESRIIIVGCRADEILISLLFLFTYFCFVFTS